MTNGLQSIIWNINDLFMQASYLSTSLWRADSSRIDFKHSTPPVLEHIASKSQSDRFYSVMSLNAWRLNNRSRNVAQRLKFVRQLDESRQNVTQTKYRTEFCYKRNTQCIITGNVYFPFLF